MFTVPIGGFSAIIYVIILLVGTVVRGSRKGTLGPIGRTLLHLIDRENDGPWRRAFAYSVASGIFLMFVGVFGTVVMDEAHAFSMEYPTGKIFYSGRSMVQGLGQEIREGLTNGTTVAVASSDPFSLHSDLFSAALCADENYCTASP